MDKYKINYIYNESQNINDIFIKVLTKEIQKYIEVIYNQFCLKGDKFVK